MYPCRPFKQIRQHSWLLKLIAHNLQFHQGTDSSVHFRHRCLRARSESDTPRPHPSLARWCVRACVELIAVKAVTAFEGVKLSS